MLDVVKHWGRYKDELDKVPSFIVLTIWGPKPENEVITIQYKGELSRSN